MEQLSQKTKEQLVFERASKKMNETGWFSFTAQDHEDLDGTPDAELAVNPGKAQYEIMTDEEIQQILDNVEIAQQDPKLVKNGYVQNLIDAMKVDIPFLKSVGRLPEKYKDFDSNNL